MSTPPRPRLPESDRPIKTQGGHWILASIGKKVLRPGGRETTDWLLSNITITGQRVVELAPGLGTTARDILDQEPGHYTAVDLDSDACDQVKELIAQNPQWKDIPHSVVHAPADATGLPDHSVDIVIAEAMLTMQGTKAKKAIMTEVHRILKPGGTYAIHEMALMPPNLSDQIKSAITKRLAQVIKVNARPMTLPEWKALAEECGFELVTERITSMSLLEPKRILADEGVIGALRMAVNLARKKEIRKRVVSMRNTFMTYQEYLRGIGIILKAREQIQ